MLSVDSKSQCLSKETMGRLLMLFIPRHGLGQSAGLIRWRVVVEFYRYFEDNPRKASCDLDIECEKKRGVNNNYKLFVMSSSKKGIDIYGEESRRIKTVVGNQFSLDNLI